MNIYILTEEKPKTSVIKQLLKIYNDDFNGDINLNEISIQPNINNKIFDFSYKVNNFTSNTISSIIIKIVSGNSSFMDFLFYKQVDEPKLNEVDDNLLFAVEETKTSDDESRNTGVYQRCSKFVFIKQYYDVPLYMLYNDELNLREEKKPSDTSILGTNMLLTLGVKIIGKPVKKWFKPFSTIDELITFKNSMKRPPANNVPIIFTKLGDTIQISGRLDKPKNDGKISHDPNIGALSVFSATLRSLGWKGKIVITRHNIVQKYVTATKGKNKFLYICKMLDITLENIVIPSNYDLPETYWHYEYNSEKIGSILLHVNSEYNGIHGIYHNHAGCERGYFKTKERELIALPKKSPNDQNLLIPDVILRDDENMIIYLIEGKKLSTIQNGLKEIEDYDDIEKLYIKKYYPNYECKRYLTIFGGNMKSIPNSKVLLYLNESGRIFVNDLESRIVEIFNK